MVTPGLVQPVLEAIEADSGLASKVDSELLNLTSERRRRLETLIRAALRLEAVDYYEAHMYVNVSEDRPDRYTVTSEHLVIYEAYVALGHSTARCAVQPIHPAPWDERLLLERACQASIKLWKLLEPEAAAKELEDGAGSPSEHTGSAAARAGPQATPPPPRSSGFSWQNVTFHFLDEHMVQVTIGEHRQPPQSYKELEFADGRTGEPSRAWLMLQNLARLGGTLPLKPPEGHYIEGRAETKKALLTSKWV